MADTVGMADIKGIQIDKLARGFADKNLKLKGMMMVTKTSAREIRWYQKTAGFVAPPTTTNTTGNLIDNVPERALPPIAGPSFTRQTSYVKKFFVESETISEEDIQDNDPDVLGHTVRDLVAAVQQRVENRIYQVLTENDTPTNIQTIAITNEWDDTTNGVPISDLLTAREYLKNYNYEPSNAILWLRPDAERFLINYLISVKGSSIPQFASAKVENAALYEICGFKVHSDTTVTSDKAVIFVPKVSATWKEFMSTTAAVINDPGIGRKIRVWEEGECLLTDPKSVVFLSNVGPS